MEVRSLVTPIGAKALGEAATPQEIANAMFESGTERGAKPFRTGCVTYVSFCCIGFGLGSSAGRARPW